jgi:hypothetical protein
MSKNIVIIEDDYDHLQIVRNLINGNDINTFPSVQKVGDAPKLTNFLTYVNHMLAADNEKLRNEKRQKFLQKILEANPISLYIVDFQIFTDKNVYNGIKFCEYIEDIREGNTPVILLTKFTDNEPLLNNTNITTLKSNLMLQFPKIRIEIVRKLQDNGKTWDEGERDSNENLKVDNIVTNSLNTKNAILNYITLFCDTTKKQVEKNHANQSSG